VPSREGITTATYLLTYLLLCTNDICHWYIFGQRWTDSVFSYYITTLWTSISLHYTFLLCTMQSLPKAVCFACLCPSRETVSAIYLQYLSMDFCHSFVIGASWDKDELIRLWGHRSRSHYHGRGITTRHCRQVYVDSLDFIRVTNFMQGSNP